MSRKQLAVNKPFNFDKHQVLSVIHSSTFNITKAATVGQNVIVGCQLEYQSEKLLLKLKSGNLIRPVYIKVYFRKQSIFDFKIRTSDDSIKPSQVITFSVSFSKYPIDFFGFSKDRIFTIVFKYLIGASEFEAKFTVSLPVVKQVELHFKRPGTTYPDAITRSICLQAFKMTNENSAAQIQRCILLEEFKLMPIVERYIAYGYVKMLELFLDVENSFELDLLKNSNLNNAAVHQLSAISFKINTDSQIPSAASSVCLTPMDALFAKMNPEDLKKVQICAPIVSFHRNYVTIEIKRKGKNIEKSARYRVEFLPNFFSNAMAQRALRQIEKHGYENFMLNFTKQTLPNQIKFQFQTFESIEWMNESVGKNFSQSQAITQIVNRSSFPSPYVVFGPPGTGKTSTLVEAVAQIVKLQPSAKVLVTVNSNSACDEIGERLLNFVGANKMFRFYAPSFSTKMERVHPKLKSCSNLKYNYHVQPSMQEIMSYNVIICTLVNSGRMKSLGLHFDYIFIDECASSAEPYVDIPLMLTMKKGCSFKASVILLGDPKQLGQIMRTHHCERFGFNISMMERVMGLDPYKFNKPNGYNPKFIVQLTDNFRSHHLILGFSNKEFYNSILNAKQLEQVANFAIGWELLPNPKFPVLFQASWAASEADGTSLYNNGDIRFVRRYVGSLLKDGINGKKVSPKEIGIISPYAAQREKLKEIYKNGIEIGTVEYFQGREKLIVIVSTVRSKTATVGFLKNEKRLNVALTRAKALLIVIGNPETLGKNKFWRKFIKMCCEHKGCAGKVPSWVWRDDEVVPVTEEDEDEAIRLEEMMNDMNLDE